MSLNKLLLTNPPIQFTNHMLILSPYNSLQFKQCRMPLPTSFQIVAGFMMLFYCQLQQHWKSLFSTMEDNLLQTHHHQGNMVRSYNQTFNWFSLNTHTQKKWVLSTTQLRICTICVCGTGKSNEKAKGQAWQDLNKRELMLQVIPVTPVTWVFITNSTEDSFLTGWETSGRWDSSIPRFKSCKV